MITTITSFRLAAPITREQAREIFLSTAPKYRDYPGLVRKVYLLSDDGLDAGGVYLWKTRADAEAMYDQAWHDFVTAKYGVAPRLSYFESPVIVDNPSGQILSD